MFDGGDVAGLWKLGMRIGIAAACLPWLAAAAEPIRVLSIADPFAKVIAEKLPSFERIAGTPIEIEIAGYTELRQRLLLNAFAPESDFDLIAIDMGWGREIKQAGITLPLNDVLQSAGVDLSTFLTSARSGATIDGQIVGLPVQPHAELLFFDADLFERLGIAPPDGVEDVLAIGSRIHQDGVGGRSGICWNAQRGAALGQTMLHLLAAFGGRPLDASGRATLDTAEMRSAIGYAVALLAISPPDILTMAWDERIEAFAAGRCAMTYGWTGRTRLMEELGLDIRSGHIGVTAAPNAADVTPISPLGAWLLAIPANLAMDRRENALNALIRLTSLEANQIYAASGVSTLLHTSLLAEPELGARHPALRILGDLEDRGELSDAMRPNIAEFQALTEILGTEVHQVLIGQTSVEAAAKASQTAFARLLEK